MHTLYRMQVSDKRLAANRANAQKSTGPKTPSGKRICSGNAIKHGILANAILIDGESRASFLELIASLEEEYQPSTPTQHALVAKIASAQWRSLRLLAVESAGIIHEMRQQSGSAAAENMPTRAMLALRSLAGNSRHYELMSRYEHRIDRQQHRSIEVLARLKEEEIARDKETHFSEENKGPCHEA